MRRLPVVAAEAVLFQRHKLSFWPCLQAVRALKVLSSQACNLLPLRTDFRQTVGARATGLH